MFSILPLSSSFRFWGHFARSLVQANAAGAPEGSSIDALIRARALIEDGKKIGGSKSFPFFKEAVRSSNSPFTFCFFYLDGHIADKTGVLVAVLGGTLGDRGEYPAE